MPCEAVTKNKIQSTKTIKTVKDNNFNLGQNV